VPEISETSRAIGTLEGKLDLLLTNYTEKGEQDRQRWHKLYDELNTLRLISMDLAALRKETNKNQETAEEHARRLDAVDALRNRFIGGVFILSIAGSVVAEKTMVWLGLK